MNISGLRSLARSSRLWLRLGLLLALVLSLLPAAPAAAKSILVGPKGDYPCTYEGVLAAFDSFNPGDYVFFIGCGIIDIAHTIQLTKNIKMTGPATFNAHGLAPVFNVHAGANVYIADLTIMGGNAGSGNGGNIVNAGHLVLSHCTIQDGQAANGGGVSNEPGATLVLVRSNTFIGNKATLNGGALASDRAAGLTELTADLFSGNSAGNDGGGIFSDGAISLAPGTVFVSNLAGYAGGGLAVSGDTIIIPHEPSSGGNRLPATADSLAAGPNLAAALSPTLFISNSAGLGGGGAIYSTGQLTLGNVAILSNTTSFTGGGIEAFTGTLQIANAFIAYNTAHTGGGGIESDWQMTATAISVISNTTTNYGGGGLEMYNGTVVISDSTFMSNTASLGGGIIVSSGKLRLDSSTVAHNTVDNAGGGLYQGSGASTSIVNSTFSANATTGLGGGGGGINNYGTLTITSSTLVSNSSPGDIGNLSNSGGAWLHNTLVAFGAPLNCSGTITSTGYNLESANTCHLHASGDLTNTLPHIGPLADNGGVLAGAGGTGLPFDGHAAWTHALLAGSPAIDHGDPANCPAFDERGAGRPVNICDIGAYEFGAKIAQTISFTLPAVVIQVLSPYALAGTATSGLTVTYTVSGAACSLAGSSLLLNSTGPCGVTAHQGGNANYNPAPDVPASTTVGFGLFLPLVTR